MTDTPFLELTCRYRSHDSDPAQPADRTQKRLFNLHEVTLVFPDTSGSGRAVLTMRDGGLFVVDEPYDYVASILSAWQPRTVGV